MREEIPESEKGRRGELTGDRFVAGKDLTTWRSAAGRWLAAVAQRIAQWIGPHLALVIALGIGAGFAALTTWLASEVYEAVVDANGVALWDEPLLEASVALRTPITEQLVTSYTDIGGVVGMPLIAVTTMVVLAVRRKSWTPVILMLAAGGGSLLMTVAGKELFGRARPELAFAVPPFEHSPSFPSGHTLNAVVVAGIVAYLLMLRQDSKRTQALTAGLAAVFAITMGMSRVYLGHHWFTDVLVAWVLGLAWLAVVITAHRLYLTTRKRIAGPEVTGEIEP
ncbi:phosphatase PAP2 family protein [Tessaracoccus oleiagri]|uniref:Undecaprenyl-diphosphatase n=1 Tax=Tessaracoccus oleiagri TaxID=686624 RepID=A0A1G9IDM4_9ACTN|nr:phosphatase PAP2 family protein [Tessaracoccus oleiagri]SDL23331.1 undecaprenyl-diphosphatase [Tessaracoccus oleiagri]